MITAESSLLYSLLVTLSPSFIMWQSERAVQRLWRPHCKHNPDAHTHTHTHTPTHKDEQAMSALMNFRSYQINW